MPNDYMKSNHNIFLYIILIICFVVIGTSFYYFYYQKEYEFIVETSCDNTQTTCFYRDCVADSDSCPPNNYSFYNKYTLKARDFAFCTDDCEAACTSGTIACQKIVCTDDDIREGICTLPFNTENE